MNETNRLKLTELNWLADTNTYWLKLTDWFKSLAQWLGSVSLYSHRSTLHPTTNPNPQGSPHDENNVDIYYNNYDNDDNNNIYNIDYDDENYEDWWKFHWFF